MHARSMLAIIFVTAGARNYPFDCRTEDGCPLFGIAMSIPSLILGKISNFQDFRISGNNSSVETVDVTINSSAGRLSRLVASFRLATAMAEILIKGAIRIRM